MAHWLMKTEPEDYSWERLVADGETEWSGVRNHQAAANMRAMKLGERVFFYRSMVSPAIVGVMAISAEAYPAADDPTGKFVRVKVKPVRPVKTRGITEGDQGRSALRRLTLVRQSRLSVVPVGDAHWRDLCEMGGHRTRSNAKGALRRSASSPGIASERGLRRPGCGLGSIPAGGSPPLGREVVGTELRLPEVELPGWPARRAGRWSAARRA